MEHAKILLVDDEPRIADTLSFGLEENRYAVSVAYDGIVGYTMFLKEKYDLLVLDINLPGLNGYELCKRIRAVNTNIPIILLTALRTLDDKIEGYDAGADDYVLKPFEFQELLMKIKVLLRRSADPSHHAGSMLRAGDLSMNTYTREVKRGDVVVSLTSKEAQLLEYLLRNKNQVVSRADIATNVWNIDFDTNTNIIDVYINYVRNKVDKPFPQKLIHTQVGLGYILKDI
ncbi:response regulator transcription factor [Chitinophaga rhizosphaerae]|uniref:response regulator transcription factor n=1 Tax=Chitinophaga rhizosphaerae TaxID=1864947 RepID=UPI000F80A383|nr:response regulator transcription factor [Chitinophaga rhizosphaerae]